MAQVLCYGVYSKGEITEWKSLELPTAEQVIEIVYSNETGLLYIIDKNGNVSASDDKGESWFEVKSGNVEELK